MEGRETILVSGLTIICSLKVHDPLGGAPAPCGLLRRSVNSHGKYERLFRTLQRSQGPLFKRLDRSHERMPQCIFSCARCNEHVMPSLAWQDVTMAPSQPSLPSNRVFVVQFRSQPTGAPVAL